MEHRIPKINAMESHQQEQALTNVKLAVFDVDGVLTDGGIFLGESEELKRFHIQDGLGLKLLIRAGIEVGILTARSSGAVERRAQELGIRHLFQGAGNKLRQLKELADSLGVDRGEVLYMGDDFADLQCLQWSGVGVAPLNAAREVLTRVTYITRQAGGNGAVREIAERILKAKGQWDAVVSEYLLVNE